MKNIIIITLLLSLFSIFFATAQDSLRGNYFCFSIGAGAGNYIPGGNLRVQYTHRPAWGLAAEWRYLQYDTKALPADFVQGLYIGKTNKIPDDIQYFYSILLTRDFFFRTAYLRWGIEAGPSFVQLQQLHFTKNPAPGFLESNYRWTAVTKNTAGLIARIRATVYPSCYWGTELAGIVHLNKTGIYAGAELNLLIGFVRKRNKDDKAHLIN